MAKPSAKSKPPSQTGCLFLLSTGLVLIGLLFLNSVFVRVFFSASFSALDKRVFSSIQFILPIVMIFLEFWVYDAAVDFFRYRKMDADARRDDSV
jgi:hypothetical protein